MAMTLLVEATSIFDVYRVQPRACAPVEFLDRSGSFGLFVGRVGWRARVRHDSCLIPVPGRPVARLEEGVIFGFHRVVSGGVWCFSVTGCTQSEMVGSHEGRVANQSHRC